MSSRNSNIFVGDRSYKTNFFLRFKGNRIEARFRDETFRRNSYTLKGFYIACLLFLSIYFMTTDCFIYYHSCNHSILLISSMFSITLSLVCLYQRITRIVIKILTMIASIYFYLVFLETQNYNTSIVLITAFTSLASFLINQTWFSQLVYNVISYALLFGYLYTSTAYELLRKPESSVIIDLCIHNAVAILFLAFLELRRRERWVLVETFKKSDKIFRQLYEELPYAFYVVDKSKRILYSSMHGLSLLSPYFINCRSCNFVKMNVNLQEILEPEYITTLDNTLTSALPSNSTEEPVACFVTLKAPTQEYDPQACRFTLERGNLYKVKVIQTTWKSNYAYLVVLKDYSSKKKSENIASKSITYLSGHLTSIIKEYDSYVVDKRQLKFKSKILSHMMKVKFAVFNTLLTFYRIFTKNDGLKDKKNFNIRTAILAVVGVQSFKAKEKKCDLQVKFEGSFPDNVYGDEQLFQQTFGNALHMLLEKLSETTIYMDCKLEYVHQADQYMLSFEFKFLKNEVITYESLSSKVDPSFPVTLEHLLSGDDLLFFLALIRPAAEVFEGKVLVDEIDNDVTFTLELLFQGSDTSKERSISEYPTFKSCNYNASGNQKSNLYFWKCEEPEEAHEAELSVSSINEVNIGFPRSQNIDFGNSSSPSRVPSKALEDLDDKRPIAKQPSNELAGSKARDQKKVRDELVKLSMGGMKNFGGANLEVKQGSSPDTPTLKKADEPQGQMIRRNITEVDEEDKDGDENGAKESAIKESGSKQNPAANGPNRDFNSFRMMSVGSFTSLPETESTMRTFTALKFHQSTLKLAITKALMDILDEKKRDESRKVESGSETPSSTYDTGANGEKDDILDIRAPELCERTLKRLSLKLTNDKVRDEFIMFAGQYARTLEDDIIRYQMNNENDQVAPMSYSFAQGGDYYSDGGYADSTPLVGVSKLNKVDKKPQSSFKLYLQKDYSRESSFSKDSERSKERNLNERFLLSPFIKTNVLASARTLNAKRDQLLPYLQPQPTLATDLIGEQEKQEKQDKLDQSKKKIVPFGQPEHMPDFMQIRTNTCKRRWTGVPNEIVNNIPEMVYIYNDVFTILAVDDSEFVFKGLESLQIKYKKRFEFAKNGSDGLKKYLSNIGQGVLYHLVLLDLQMPIMDGFETVRVIRAKEADKSYPPTYICAMSAFEDQETIQKTRKEGMDNFCQKPLRAEVLTNLIKMRCEALGIPLPE